MGRGGTCACIEGNPNSNCCGCVRKSIIKSFEKLLKSHFNSRSTGEFVKDFTIKLPCEVVQKSLLYGNFILSPTVLGHGRLELCIHVSMTLFVRHLAHKFGL